MDNAIFSNMQIVLGMTLSFSFLIKVFRRQLYGYKRKVRLFVERLVHEVFLLGYDQRSSCSQSRVE
jgi:hypothetical protein